MTEDTIVFIVFWLAIAKFYRAIDDELYASIPYMVHTAFSNMIK